MDDPMVTNDFIKSFVKLTSHEIVAVFVSKSGQFSKVSRNVNRFDFSIPISLLIISGFNSSLNYFLKFLDYRIQNLLQRYFGRPNRKNLRYFCDINGISYYETKSVCSSDVISKIRGLKADLIFNQAQEILTEDFLESPKIGVLNRHNSLLPKFRGRLAPFWVLRNKESYTGVTIHLIGEKIDKGPIVVQKKFPITTGETYVSLTKKCYKVAILCLNEAVNRLSVRTEEYPTPVGQGSYYSFPTIREAIAYRLGR